VIASDRVIVLTHFVCVCVCVCVTIAEPPVHALIDTGALITGLDNEVARLVTRERILTHAIAHRPPRTTSYDTCPRGSKASCTSTVSIGSSCCCERPDDRCAWRGCCAHLVL
jgi:hypothetical protein